LCEEDNQQEKRLQLFMKFACPSCGRVYDEDLQAGTRVECACSQRFRPGSERGRSMPGEFRIGEVVGRCMLLQVLGRGAMGTVYRGRHIALDLPVAVKILRSEFQLRPDYMQRFLREARTAGEINHPNIVRILDSGQKNQTLFLIMEYVPGGDVGRWLEFKTRLSVEETLKIGRSISRGLIAAENLGIIHRDIKPQNIMRASNGEYKLADLGMAKHVLGSGNEATITTVAVAMGTPHYMAPEQARDARCVDHRADIYSLGASLYHMLSGAPPFPRENSMQVLDAHADEPLPPLNSINPDVPAEVANIVHLCLAKRPEDRYQSAAELHHDIKLLLNPAKTNRPETMIVDERRNLNRMRRVNLIGAIVLAILISLLALVLVLGWITRRSPVANDQDRSQQQLLQLRVGQLRRQLRSAAEQQPEQRANLLVALTTVMCELGTAEAAIETFEELIRQVERCDQQQRQQLREAVNTAVTAFVLSPAATRAKVSAHLPYIRGLVGELYRPDMMHVDADFTQSLGQYLRLHTNLTTGDNYWLHLRYNLKQWSELSDFYRGRVCFCGDSCGHDLKQWQVRDAALHAPTGGCSTPLLWRLPHHDMFSLTLEYTPADNVFDAHLLLAVPTAAGFVPMPESGLRLHSRVRGNQIRHQIIAGGNVLAGLDTAAASDKRIRVRLELVAPQLSVRINDQTLFAGEVPQLTTAIEGHWGVQLQNGGSIANLQMAFPAEDLASSEFRSQTFFYPLGTHGSRRFDQVATINAVAQQLLEVSREKLIDLPPQLPSTIAFANGQLLTLTEPETAAVLRFPVLRDADDAAGELQFYIIGRTHSTDTDSRFAAGQLQLWNAAQRQWQDIDYRATYLTAPQLYLIHLTHAFSQLGEHLEFDDELLLRYSGGASVQIDHALLLLNLP